MKAAGELSDTLFTAVGYGTVRDGNQGGFAGILDNLERNQAVQSFLSLNAAWLLMSMNESTGNGGTCYGIPAGHISST